MSDGDHALLSMRGIEKSFPGVRALAGVDLHLERGQVLALMGENGAGKSTLIKVLSGAHQADAGEIRIDGQVRRMASPQDALAAGVGVIYQEFNLLPALSARENIFLGQEKTRAGFIAKAEESRRARELFARIGVAIDPEVPCRQLTVAQQQIVEIAKALSLDARILVMDEPTAALTNQEVERLFAVIEELKAQFLGIIYVSHRMEEIFRISDRITVMRDGEYVGTRDVTDVTRRELIELMVGRDLEHEFPKRTSSVAQKRLEVRNLNRGASVRDVSFDVHAGEVLALTGLVGAGRTETARLLFGADQADSGTVNLDGKRLQIRNPRDAIRNGICLLTEDRKAQGLVLGLSVRENFGLPNLPALSRLSFVNKRDERRSFAGFVDSLRIKIPNQEALAKNLSGGNQQKVVLAKWLQSNSEVVIFDEPTRGIDVGAKFEIYQLIDALAREGKAILLISSELPEVLGMADRILVMHEGRVCGEIRDVASAKQEDILALAVGEGVRS